VFFVADGTAAANDCIDSVPCIANGAIFVSTDNGAVFRLSIQDGSVAWNISLPEEYRLTALCHADDRLYFGDGVGNLHKVSDSFATHMAVIQGRIFFSDDEGCFYCAW